MIKREPTALKKRKNAFLGLAGAFWDLCVKAGKEIGVFVKRR
jgi:hypothetical protein